MRDSSWVVDVLLVSVLMLDVHGVQAQVDSDMLLQVVRWVVSGLPLNLDFLNSNQLLVLV